MIAKNRRLTKRQVEYIQRKGDKFESRNFIIKHAPSDTKAKFCIIISKKFASKAVERNKFRRQMYEIIRKNEVEELENNIVIIPKKSVLNRSYQEIEIELTEILKTFNG